MTRKYIDCREHPSEQNCSVAISADNEQELLDAAVQHAVAVHHHQDTPALRQQIRQLIQEAEPPVNRPLAEMRPAAVVAAPAQPAFSAAAPRSDGRDPAALPG